MNVDRPISSVDYHDYLDLVVGALRIHAANETAFTIDADDEPNYVPDDLAYANRDLYGILHLTAAPTDLPWRWLITIQVRGRNAALIANDLITGHLAGPDEITVGLYAARRLT